MKYWLVREYEEPSSKTKPADWDDAVRIMAADEHEAAEQYAQRKCACDSETYSSYESGRVLEVKELRAETATLVTVSVSFNPHFRSRIKR